MEKIKDPHIGFHSHKRGGLLEVREHPDGYEIIWPHPKVVTGELKDDLSRHGGKVTCNRDALLRYLHRDVPGHPDPDAQDA